MGPRPTSVTVLAVIGFVWGGLAVLGSCCGSLNFLPPNGSEPLKEATWQHPGYMAYLGVTMLVNLGIAGLLLASSWGSLQLRPWARMGMVAYAWSSMALQLLGLVVHYAYVMPVVIGPALRRMPMTPGMPAGFHDIMRMAMYVGPTCGIVIGAALPICILVFFNKSAVKDAFAAGLPADPTGFGGPSPESGPQPGTWHE